ncbi:MAG: hypothetical protein IJH53_03440 [Oscillospiraceae bacterium]|nr:hypothetical protein [Oscillospiraceae bacterium]
MKKVIDWNAVKNDYVTGTVSYRNLGSKYAISSSNISRHGRREDWPALRQKYQEELVAQYARLAAERDAAYVAEMKEKVVCFSRILAKKMEETLSYDEPFAPRDLSMLQKALSLMQGNLESFLSCDRKADDRSLNVVFVNGDWENEGS